MPGYRAIFGSEFVNQIERNTKMTNNYSVMYINDSGWLASVNYRKVIIEVSRNGDLIIYAKQIKPEYICAIYAKGNWKKVDEIE